MAHVYARPHHMLQTEEEVLDIVEDDPSTSTREIARQLNAILKEKPHFRFHPVYRNPPRPEEPFSGKPWIYSLADHFGSSN
ncbi:hypothetical protein NQ317_006499 [Molorchus minor]|uniref:Uncharacterized protein n=1 Tax=Molorchus minor TaxID=1323400 RepID=A0ABQ9ITW8_9CUCU|nr:hypothetical protein NQ317_006499 [Molorchus minor]